MTRREQTEEDRRETRNEQGGGERESHVETGNFGEISSS